MKSLFKSLLTLLLLLYGCKSPQSVSNQDEAMNILGGWVDDYEITYSITSDTWELGSDITFHILEWNKDQQYLIVKNDDSNAYNAGLYSKIDYTSIKGMEPYSWAYCLTAYDKSSEKDARDTPTSDKSDPKIGCNGFPFSRMKKK